MRIVVWNAHQALHRKQGELNRLRPDIAVIPECSDDMEATEGCVVWVGSSQSITTTALSPCSDG
jgi:hypothetical protein